MKKKIVLSRQLIRDYERLTREMAIISGMAYHYRAVFNNYERAVLNRESIPNTPKNIKDFVLGSHFCYRSPLTGKLLFGGDSYEVHKTNVVKKVSLLRRKTNNYLIANGYELFERFLRIISSRIVIKNMRSAIEFDNRLGFQSQVSCYKFLNSQYRNNQDLIRLLRHLIPELDAAFKKRKKINTYLDLYRALVICRNHIIHSNEEIDTRTVNKMGSNERFFIKSIFNVDPAAKSKRQKIDASNNTKQVLEALTELAFLIITSFDSSYLK